MFSSETRMFFLTWLVVKQTGLLKIPNFDFYFKANYDT